MYKHGASMQSSAHVPFAVIYILVAAPASSDAPLCTNMISHIIVFHLWPNL